MAEGQECALCGTVYLNAERHQAWHDEVDAWIQAIEQELSIRMRKRLRQRDDD